MAGWREKEQAAVGELTLARSLRERAREGAGAAASSPPASITNSASSGFLDAAPPVRSSCRVDSRCASTSVMSIFLAFFFLFRLPLHTRCRVAPGGGGRGMDMQAVWRMARRNNNVSQGAWEEYRRTGLANREGGDAPLGSLGLPCALAGLITDNHLFWHVQSCAKQLCVVLSHAKLNLF